MGCGCHLFGHQLLVVTPASSSQDSTQTDTHSPPCVNYRRSVLAETVTATSDRTVLITLGAFTLVGTMFTGMMTFLASRHAKTAKVQATEANQAVNTVPKDQPRLYTLVEDLYRQSDLRHREVRTDLDSLHSDIRGIRTRVDALEQPGWDGKTERRRNVQPYSGLEQRRRQED